MTSRTQQHQTEAEKLDKDVAAFLAKGGKVTEVPTHASNERWLKSIDKVVRERGKKQTKADKFLFNGPMRVPGL